MVIEARQERANRTGRQRTQVEEDRQGDGKVDVVGIYGFWINGGVALSRLTLRCARMTGLLFAKPESATANWPDADWASAQMDPVAALIRVRDFRLEGGACDAAARLVLPAGSSEGGNATRRALGPQPTKLAPARPKICLQYFLIVVNFFYLIERPLHLAERLITTHPSSQNSTSQSPPRG